MADFLVNLLCVSIYNLLVISYPVYVLVPLATQQILDFFSPTAFMSSGIATAIVDFVRRKYLAPRLHEDKHLHFPDVCKLTKHCRT